MAVTVTEDQVVSSLKIAITTVKGMDSNIRQPHKDKVSKGIKLQ